MNYGYVVLAATKGEWAADGIEWFTGSRFSHSFVTVPPQAGLEMCIEASGKGIDEVPFDSQYRQNPTQSYLVYQVNLPKEVIDQAIDYVLETLEQSYAYLAYPWFIWRFLLWKIFKKDIKAKNNWYTKEYVCSGLVRLYLDSPPVRAYLETNGMQPLFNGFGQGSVTPEDLYAIYNSNPNLFKLIETKNFTS
jgi:hypothetical protein